MQLTFSVNHALLIHSQINSTLLEIIQIGKRFIQIMKMRNGSPGMSGDMISNFHAPVTKFMPALAP